MTSYSEDKTEDGEEQHSPPGPDEDNEYAAYAMRGTEIMLVTSPGT